MASPFTRRSVLGAGISSFVAPSLISSSNHGIRLGAPIFLKTEDPAELAAEHRRLNYGAAYCPQADIRDKDRISAIEKAFKAQNVVIAEVGAWKNLLDPDATKRSANLTYVTERCALADVVINSSPTRPHILIDHCRCLIMVGTSPATRP